ncbi:SRPBCC family protein, partial [Streptomyces niveiscabiei]|uniref:SRPBCC family protein n=1 Tax=Streptomyces niveiscabiei TaxID=164115 RepID=UPI0038F5E17D
MRINRTIETDTPLTEVFSYLSDFRSTNDWDPGTVETTRTSGDGGVGTIYHNVSSFMGRETEL